MRPLPISKGVPLRGGVDGGFAVGEGCVQIGAHCIEALASSRTIGCSQSAEFAAEFGDLPGFA
jgi:hypothetical protein